MINQKFIPALKTIRDVERIINTSYEYVVLMDIHIAQLAHCCKILKQVNKKILIHLDLMKGLSSDEYSVEYVIQQLGVDGIISTKSSVIKRAKELNKISVQRIFLLDSQSYQKGINHIQMSKPDYIELLPGCLGKMIKRIKDDINVNVLAGGLIETVEEVNEVIKQGATSVTSSAYHLIKYFSNKS